MHDRRSARMALRTATAARHDAVDAIFSRANLADRAGYARFLMAQAGAHIAVEDALDVAGAGGIVPDWDSRRRGDAVRADLAALAVDAPAATARIDLDGPAAVFGAAYVLEGSRLGGAMLARAVPEGFPRAFLRPGAPGAWRRFVAELDRVVATPADIERATEAAHRAFSMFEQSGRHHLGVN